MRIAVGLGLLLVLNAIAHAGDDAPAPPPVAQYDGKTAAGWTAALASDDVKLRQRAAYGLFKLGADAGGGAGALVKALHDADAYVRTTSAKAIPRLPAESVKPHVAALAADLLGESQDVRREAGSVLWRLGPLAADVVPELTKALASADEIVRANAAGCLANAGAAAKPALPAVTKALDDADENVRNWATKAIVAIDPVAAFASEKTAVRLAAIQAYSDPSFAGWKRPEIVACVLKAIEDPAEDNRGWAVHALDTYAAFAGDARPVEWIAVFKKVLATSRTPGARSNAAAGLGRYTDHGPEVVPVLIEAAKHREPEAQRGALLALGWFGEGARSAVPVVLEALRSEDGETRSTAAAALGGLGDSSDAVIDALVARVADDERWVKRHAIESLGRLGKGSSRVAEVLVGVITAQGTDPYIGGVAVDAIVAAELRDRAIPPITAAFEKKETTRPVVAFALVNLDAPGAPQALAKLIAMAESGDQLQDVIGALRLLGPKSAPAVPALTKLLAHADAPIRVLAAVALGSAGAAAKDALPALDGLQSDAGTNVALAAKQSAASIREAIAAAK